MEWRDTGILLATRRHGEGAVILDMFTPLHGRHAGVLHGGASRKMAPHLQPGAQLDLHWRARLSDHLGTFRAEPLRGRAAQVLGDRMLLAGLSATCALLAHALPERDPQPALFAATEALLDLLDSPDIWPTAYLHWEMGLLEVLGFGLDLRACAVTGATRGLVYVSPRTGRAVTAEGAGDWAPQLLPLPPVMLGTAPADAAQVAQALHTTGHFLEAHVAAPLGRPLPAARAALIARLSHPRPA